MPASSAPSEGFRHDRERRVHARCSPDGQQIWLRAGGRDLGHPASLAVLVEAVPDAAVVVSQSGLVVAANTRCTAILGYEPAFLVGQPLDLLLPVDRRSTHRGNVARYFAEPTARPMGKRLPLTARRADGTEIPVDVSLNPLATAAGTVVIAGIRDVSHIRRAASELRASERQLRTLVDDLRFAAVSIDPRGTIRYCNKHFAQLTEYPAEELVGTNWVDRLCSSSGSARTWLERAAGEDFVSEFEASLPTRRGNTRLMAWSSTRHLDEKGAVVTITCIGEDITAKRALEDEQRSLVDRLTAVSAERASLLARLTNAEERERRKIAEELHDDTIQWLTAANLLIGTLPVASELRARVEEVSTILSSSIGKLRRLTFDLHPATLGHAGLVSSLNRLLSDFAEETGIEVSFASNRYEGPIDQQQAACLYRICRETVVNVRKHSRATQVEATLSTEGEDVLLVLSDNGVGQASHIAPSAGHLGLLSMRERAELAGGTLQIHTPAAGGVTVCCRLPRRASSLPTDPAAPASQRQPPEAPDART
jgi:PAS domain S-box-containing protein